MTPKIKLTNLEGISIHTWNSYILFRYKPSIKPQPVALFIGETENQSHLTYFHYFYSEGKLQRADSTYAQNILRREGLKQAISKQWK